MVDADRTVCVKAAAAMNMASKDLTFGSGKVYCDAKRFFRLI